MVMGEYEEMMLDFSVKPQSNAFWALFPGFCFAQTKRKHTHTCVPRIGAAADPGAESLLLLPSGEHLVPRMLAPAAGGGYIGV
jgi:hypothetical protein